MRTVAASLLVSGLLVQDALAQGLVTPTIVVTTHVSACKTSGTGLLSNSTSVASTLLSSSGLPSSSSSSSATLSSQTLPISLALSSTLLSTSSGSALPLGSTSSSTSIASSAVTSASSLASSPTSSSSAASSTVSTTSSQSSSSATSTPSTVPVCGQSYPSYNGTDYDIICGQTYTGDEVFPGEPSRRRDISALSFEACIDYCDDISSCVAAGFVAETCRLLASITAIINTVGAQAAIRAEYAEIVLPRLANRTTTSSVPGPTVATATEAYSSAIADHISQKISDNAPIPTSNNTMVYFTSSVPITPTSSSSAAAAASSLVSDYISQHLSDNAPLQSSTAMATFTSESLASTSSAMLNPSTSATFSISPSYLSGIPGLSTYVTSSQTSNSPSSSAGGVSSGTTSSGVTFSSSASASNVSSVYVDRRAAITSPKKKPTSSKPKTSSKHNTFVNLHKSSSTAHKSSSTLVVKKIVSTKKTVSVHINTPVHKSTSPLKPATAQHILKKKSTSSKHTSTKHTTSKKVTLLKKATTSKKSTKKKSTSSKKSTSKHITSSKKASSTKKSSSKKVTTPKASPATKITSKKTSTTSSKKYSTSHKKIMLPVLPTLKKKTSTSSKKTSTSQKPKTTSTKKSTAKGTSRGTPLTTSRKTTLATSTRSSASATPTYVKNSGKRGLAYDQANLTLPFSNRAGSQVSWAYDWYYAPCSDTNITTKCAVNPALEFVPLLYNNDPNLLAQWPAAAQAAIDAGSTAIMSFNEPDFCIAGSACMSVTTAVTYYQQYIQPFAGKALLGAPAVTNSGSTDANPMGLKYLQYFMGNCTGCTVDFINLHWYSNKYAGASYLESHVSQAHAMFPGKPIWLTEFGLDSSFSYTDAELQSFLMQVMPWLDQQGYVSRYAYFMDAPGILISKDGAGISGTGSVYDRFVNGTRQPNLFT